MPLSNLEAGGIARCLAQVADRPSDHVDSFFRLLGDVSGDRVVGVSDFLTLSSNFGSAADAEGGDLDGDGFVGFSDFLLLSSSFGQSLSDPDDDVPPMTEL